MVLIFGIMNVSPVRCIFCNLVNMTDHNHDQQQSQRCPVMMFFTNYFTLLIPPIKCLVVLVDELDAINLTTQILLLH